MRRPVTPVVLGLLLVLTLLSASAAAETAHGAGLRVNELLVVGTHKAITARSASASRPPTTRRSTPGDYDAFLAYSHTTLPRQFARQNVRGLELDLFVDPQGGLYASPLIRTAVGLGPLVYPAWRAPGDGAALNALDAGHAGTPARSSRWP